MSVEEVLEQDLFTNVPSEENAEKMEMRKALTMLAQNMGPIDQTLFVNMGIEKLTSVLEMSRGYIPGFYSIEIAFKLLSQSTINAGTIFKIESGLWLKNINRRLAAKCSIRHPYFVEMRRDIPHQIFEFLFKFVGHIEGFARPFCCLSKTKNSELIVFTTVRLVNELLALLSGYSRQEVATCFQRQVNAGSRKGHKLSVLVSDAKPFQLQYKANKLTISFHYGEWNSNGFPQHQM